MFSDTNIAIFAIYLTVFCGVAAVVMFVRDLVAVRGQRVRTSSLRNLSINNPGSLSVSRRFDRWFAKLVYQSGLGMSVATASLAMAFVCLLVGGGIFVLTEDLMWTALSALLTCLAYLGSLLIAQRRNLDRFEKQFPLTLDLLARAVRSGESLEQAISLVGKASKGPVGFEFRQCSRQLDMGLSLSGCMAALAKRMDIFDVKIFSGTVSIHREMGGNLSTTLERLATVIRDRTEYRGHLKSVTGAGRFSIGVIAILGPILFAFLFVVQPEYGQSLWVDPLGKIMLIVAAVLQILGLISASRLIKAEF